MSDEAHLVPIPDPLDLDAPDFTDEHRREIVEWAVKTSRDALDPDRPEELLRVFPYAVIVLQFETALRAAEDEAARLTKAIEGETAAYESGFRAGMGATS